MVLSQTAASVTPDAVMKEDMAWPQASMAKVYMPWRANQLRSRPPSPPPARRAHSCPDRWFSW
jgi:hypothetical protein